ncbi:MAG: tetratricopeptide repeat protein [Leptolyngbyaceae cyanobacterium]
MALNSLARWHRWLIAIALTLTSWAAMPLLVWAQLSPVLIEEFLSDPEQTEPRDPLLPELPVSRPLSPLEQVALEVELDELAIEAESLYLAGQEADAFALWMRELRLRRILGYEKELAAVQRIGLRMWENSRADEVQLITLRLRQIQADLFSQAQPDQALLEALVAGFETLRDVDAAVAVYETLIERAMQASDRDEQQRLLERLASLRESWFRFEVAGQTYAALLALLEGNDELQEIEYLKGAIRNYEDAAQLRQAIDYQRQLLRKYEQVVQPQPIPSLTLAIARNFRELGSLPQAQTFYSTTYSVALAQGQTDVASEALRDLADIYLAEGQSEDVLYLYQQRLAVERLSYNGYGMMQTFDQIGQFFESQDLPDNAIAAYQEALIIAEQLNYRDGYFKLRLQQLLYEQGRLNVPLLEAHLANPVGPLQDPDAWQGNIQP